MTTVGSQEVLAAALVVEAYRLDRYDNAIPPSVVVRLPSL